MAKLIHHRDRSIRKETIKILGCICKVDYVCKDIGKTNIIEDLIYLGKNDEGDSEMGLIACATLLQLCQDDSNLDKINQKEGLKLVKQITQSAET